MVKTLAVCKFTFELRVPQLSAIGQHFCLHSHSFYYYYYNIGKRHQESACIKTIAGIVRISLSCGHRHTERERNNKNSHLFVVVYFSHSFRSYKWTATHSCLIDSIDSFACVSLPMISSLRGVYERASMRVGSIAIVCVYSLLSFYWDPSNGKSN